MQTQMTMVKDQSITVTLYADDEEKVKITKLVAEGAREEDASFIVLKNRLRRDIGEGAPQFFPTPVAEVDE